MYSLITPPQQSRSWLGRCIRSMGSLNTHTLNVIQLGIGFFFIFCAFNSQGFIEETVINGYAAKGHIDKHDGYTSLAIIYGVFTVANFVAAPIVEFLNARWAMVFGAITYGLFQVGFLHLNQTYLYASSALIGLGAAVIWTAQGKYLSLNSTPETASRHSGLFWAISQGCLVVGGIFLFIVLRSSSPSVGVDGGAINKDIAIPDSTVKLLYWAFTGVTVLGTVILALLRLPNQLTGVETGGGVEVIQPQPQQQPPLSQVQVVRSTLKLARTPSMLFLVLAFAYTGVELSFWSAVYPTCIANTHQLGDNTKQLLALNAIAMGIGQSLSGFIFGILGSKTRRLGRDRIVALGTMVHLVTFVLVYANIPSDAPLIDTMKTAAIFKPSAALALLCGFLLGFGDACWNTQIFSHLITRYPTRSAQAFSLFKFFQSLLTSAAFLYSKAFQLQWHLLLLVVGALVGCVGFFVAERLPPGGEDDEVVAHVD